jgi:hypothetical protein
MYVVVPLNLDPTHRKPGFEVFSMRFALKFAVIFGFAFAVAGASPAIAAAAPGSGVAPAKTMPRPKFVKSILFKQGSSKISDLKTLDRFAKWLQFKQDVTDIRLEGFHCEADRKKEGVSNEEMLDYLLFIARERAEAVRAALIARGMEGRKFEIVPLGIADDPAVCKVIAMAMEPVKKPGLPESTNLGKN